MISSNTRKTATSLSVGQYTVPSDGYLSVSVINSTSNVNIKASIKDPYGYLLGSMNIYSDSANDIGQSVYVKKGMIIDIAAISDTTNTSIMFFGL